MYIGCDQYIKLTRLSMSDSVQDTTRMADEITPYIGGGKKGSLA